MKNGKNTIVFVCTDNIGRSVIAEYVLKDYIKNNRINNFCILSSGTDASSDISGFSMAHFDELKKLGIDASEHKRRQLTKELVDTADLLISFDTSHQEWIKKHFGIISPLFNQIYKNEESSLRCKEFGENLPKDERMIKITDYIHNAMPVLFENIKKEYL